MLTYEECLELSDLTADEVDAIAEHEHMDPMIAMALGHYILTHDGDQKIRKSEKLLWMILRKLSAIAIMPMQRCCRKC